jgi:hypothetical protein
VVFDDPNRLFTDEGVEVVARVVGCVRVEVLRGWEF